MNAPLDNTPLSREELAHYRLLSERGETPPLSIIRRFVLTIRKNFLSSPKTIEKGKTTRNAKPKPTDDTQIDFF